MSINERNQKIAKQVVTAHHQIQQGVTKAYQRTETMAVDGFNNISDKFIARFFTRDGEDVASAKARLKASAEESKRHHQEKQ